MTKTELRKQFVEQRKKLTADEVKSKNQIIFQRLVGIDQLRKAKNVAAYLSISNEVDTKLIINRLISKGKRVFLPRFLGNTPGVSNERYVFAEFTGWDNLEPGPYGITQPKSDTPGVGSDSPGVSLNVAIVPGVAFDKRGVRLGYGKGVFDRLLSGSAAFKIGLAYDFQIVDELPKEEHDLVMDLVVTESKVI